jgi:hypothetical protein
MCASGKELEFRNVFNELCFLELAFWLVAISFNEAVFNLSCVAGADDTALNAKCGPLLDACGI